MLPINLKLGKNQRKISLNPKTLESVTKLEKWNKNIEVIVVDSGSTDRTAAIAKSFGVQVVSLKRRGVSLARQVGIEAARGEIIACTDADTLVPSDWVIKITKELLKSKTIAVFGTYQVIDGPIFFRLWTNHIQPVLVRIGYISGTPLATGQNFAFWSKAAQQVGGFDTTLPYMEDIDLAIRLRNMGKVVYLPSLRVFSSGRRGKEGWKFFYKRGYEEFCYLILGQKKFHAVEDFR